MNKENLTNRLSAVDWGGRLARFANPILAIIIAFFMGGLMVLVSGDNPLDAYAAILKGAFGSWNAVKTTVRYTIPILLLAYSFSLCDRCGYFNISHEAQMYAASLAMVLVSELTPGLPSAVRLVLILAAACIAAAVVCIIPALASIKLGVSDVVVGIMLNYLMQHINRHMIAFSFIAAPSSNSIMSLPIPETIGAPLITVVAFLVVVAYKFILNRTVPGYRLKIVGQNPRFATASGLSPVKILISSAAIGGLLTAICAIGELLGYYHVIYIDFAVNMGFNGMIAALVGSGGPIGMVLGALLIGALKSGSVLLTVVTDVPSELVDCVQGFVMFFATVSLIRPGRKRGRRKQQKEPAEKKEG